MTDVHTPAQRSRNMASIKAAHTKPEMRVRSLVRGMGLRCRLHVSKLPGKPDLVFPKLRKIIFVHGCFWHMHRCRYGRVVPATNAEFWRLKRLSNVTRDRKTLRALRKAGWNILTVWECQLKQPERIQQALCRFFGVTAAAPPRGREKAKERTLGARRHSASV